MNPRFSEAVEAFRSGDLDRARALAESELSSSPSAELHHLLGVIHCRLGDPAEGVEHLRAAATEDPSNPVFQLMLIRSLIDSGRSGEVLEMPRPPEIRSGATLELWRALGEAADTAGNQLFATEAWSKVAAASPRDWRAWANLGNAFALQEQWSDAADALSKASSINPNELNIHRNAGAAFAHSNRLEDALKHLRIVASALPDDAENHGLLGLVLAALRRHDEAIAEFETANRLGGASVATELGLGRSLVAKVRFAEAEEPLARAYALDPENRSVVYHYGVALDRNNKVEQLAKLLDDAAANGFSKDELSYLLAVLARREGRLEEAYELLLRSDPDDGDPVAWNHLRAKLADALGKAAEAFQAAAEMNRIALEVSIPEADREGWQSTSVNYRREQHELARSITPQWASRVPMASGPSQRRIAFLVGFPRSGTTLLDTLLMGHPQISVLEEEQLVGKAALGLKVKDLPTASADFIEQARGTYLEGLSKLVGKDFDGLVVDKFPLDMASAPLIQAMFPGAPFIFAQRHPCDVVLSGFMQTFGLVNFNTIEDAADYYDAMMSIWTAARDTMRLNSHTVIYEELVADPELVMKGVLDFLGLGWDSRVLDHQRTAKERGTILTPSYDQVTQPITKAASGRWERYRKQLEPVLPLLLPWAKRLGYKD